MSLTMEQHLQFCRDLGAMVSSSLQPDTLPEVAEKLALALRRLGLPIDRLQLPLSVLFGLKHPLYVGIVLTWTHEDGSTAWLRPRTGQGSADSLKVLRGSPFAPVVLDEVDHVHIRLADPEWGAHKLLRKLGDIGYVDYIATAMPLPDGARQVISIATRSEGGFDDAVVSLIQTISPVLTMALSHVYQTQTVYQLTTTYLGERTGRQVLSGKLGRGHSESLLAAIAFIDVRDFTQLSNELGVERIVALLNVAFEAIDSAIRSVGGEVLKLMGDAALVVFPRNLDEEVPCIDILHALLDTVTAVTRVTEAQGCGLRVGIGLHIGEVFYGNVGAVRRHDFTVMGPAVNLASRLEGLTKSSGDPLIISNAVAVACRDTCGTPEDAAERLQADIQYHGAVAIKGEPDPVPVWGLSRRD
ncbi:MAG: adenylate/guanylate cyclase domain-containing protein [Myxococcota bacterium]|nr:adenylate/guanylate cyclase domain-containing protein [Myxococcota bacterium]